MRNLAPNFWNSTAGSDLYCVWVPVHEDGRDPLVSIWIDPAATPFVRHEGNDVDRIDAEDLNCVLPLCD
jgi:hypothetical protein